MRGPDPQPAAQRLDPVGQAAQDRSRARVGAADTVVEDLDDQLAGRRGSPTVAAGRVRVLADVREALADHVEGGHLDRLGSRPSSLIVSGTGHGARQ